MFTTMEEIEAMPEEQKVWYAALSVMIMKHYQVRKNRTNTKITAYSNSTDDKRAFHNWLTNAYFTNRNITPAMVAIEMNVSRKAVDQWVKDWEAEGWLTKHHATDGNKFYIKPNFEAVMTSIDFFDFHEEAISPMVNEARTAYLHVRDDKLRKSRNAVTFKPMESANMKGIEEVTTNFIINPRKNRKVAK